MNTFTLGIPTEPGPFLISFTYYAHGKLYSDDFISPTYLEQGAIFPIFYNPLAPHQNSKSASATTGKTPLFALGLACSILLSLLYLGMMHGCN
jgi:hypothetical protein